MVLLELSQKITTALKNLGASGKCNQEELDTWLQGLCKALLQSDVYFKTVVALRTSLKADIDQLLAESNLGTNAIRKKVTEFLVRRMTEMLEPAKKEKQLVMGERNMVMFVGLEGSGKTTSVVKFANYYKRKGFSPAVICADTFRAGAYDQLCQQAAKHKIPFYGNREETDPAKVAKDGAEKLTQAKHDLIIVDTSGRHKQEAALFEEMKLIQSSVDISHVVLVIDSHLGQSCLDQATAFAEAVTIGSVILTKMDGHAKGGGALAAVAATGAPITFVGTGEHAKDFEKFSSKGFVSELLGLGNLDSIFDEISNMATSGNVEVVENMLKGQFTYDDLYTQSEMISNMNMGSLLSKIPGMPTGVMTEEMEKEGYAKLQKLKIIIQSMTKDERAARVELDDARIRRLAIGSGTSIVEVQNLKDQYAVMKSTVKGISSMMQNMPTEGGMPDLSSMFGGQMPDMSAMMNMMGGGGGGMPGMPGMPGMGGMPGGMPAGMPDFGEMMRSLTQPKAKAKAKYRR